MAGVGLTDDAVFIQVVVTDFAFLPVVEHVRKAVRAVLQSNGLERSVNVHVADLDLDTGVGVR